VPDAVVEERIDLAKFGPVQASLVAEEPEEPMLNFILGAAEPGAVAAGHLADAVEWLDSHGVDYRIPVTPGLAGSGATEDWLNRNGYERSAGWMTFCRDASPPGIAEPPGIQIHELADSESETTFSNMVAEGFDLPGWASTFFFDLPDQAGWRCYIAVDDYEVPIASAAMLIHEGVAQFGLAATVETARGWGCHAALLRRRILDAAEAGCRVLFGESLERDPERPSAAYRNLLRAGFKEAYLRPDWRLPRLAAAPY